MMMIMMSASRQGAEIEIEIEIITYETYHYDDNVDDDDDDNEQLRLRHTEKAILKMKEMTIEAENIEVRLKENDSESFKEFEIFFRARRVALYRIVFANDSVI